MHSELLEEWYNSLSHLQPQRWKNKLRIVMLMQSANSLNTNKTKQNKTQHQTNANLITMHTFNPAMNKYLLRILFV